VLAFALLFPTAAAWVYFAALSPAVAADQGANPAMQAAYTACKVIQFGLPVAWLAFADRQALRPPPLGWRGVPAGMAFGLAVAAAAFVLYSGWLADSLLFQDTPERLRSKVAEFGCGTPARYLGLAAFLALAHSLLEEYYWRWFVFGQLRRHVRPVAAAVLSGSAFMGHHVIVLNLYFPGWFWAAVVPLSLGIAVGGVVWAWLYERSGSLLGPWVSHLIVDAALMAIGYDILFRRG
jgi:membrane protease YdiL (CAAX protease family)